MCCASYALSQTGATNIHTNFRFELEMMTDPNNATLGINDKLTAFITSCDLPCAPGKAIPWYMPGGMKNHQAGKRETKEISLQFVVCSDVKQSWIRTLQKWGNACYNLNTGNNAGKAGYSVDGVVIRVKGEDGITRYLFRLLRAQVTDVNYGTLNSEGNELLKIDCKMVYDNYEVYDSNNTLIEQGSNL